MSKPHKHAELIKAWADGAQIEIFSKRWNRWEDTDAPIWEVDSEYRLKPEPPQDVVVYTKICALGVAAWSGERNPIDNIRLTFDGETGNLKAAEVLR